VVDVARDEHSRMQESSTLTSLFTDIEGSTSKWEEQPENMAQAVGRHDTLLRDAVHAHRGRIVKTTGDDLCGIRDAVGRAWRRDRHPARAPRSGGHRGSRFAYPLRTAHRPGAGARQRLLRRHDQPHGADHERRARRANPGLPGNRRAGAGSVLCTVFLPGEAKVRADTSEIRHRDRDGQRPRLSGSNNYTLRAGRSQLSD
jgi:hypothetical protein